MKTNDYCTNIKSCAASLWQKAKRPTVRQTLRYDFNLYPDGVTTDQNAMKFHFGGTHSCPLWKLVLVATVAIVTLLITWECHKEQK